MKQMNNIPLKTKLLNHFQTLHKHLQEASPGPLPSGSGFQSPLLTLQVGELNLLVWPTIFFLDFELEEWRKKTAKWSDFGKGGGSPEERAFMLSEPFLLSELVLQSLFLSAGYQRAAQHLTENSGLRNGEKEKKTERFEADNEQRKKKKAAQKGIIHFHFKSSVLRVIIRTGAYIAHSQSEAVRTTLRPPPPPGTDGPQNQLTSLLLSVSHLCLRLYLLHSELPHWVLGGCRGGIHQPPRCRGGA